MMPQHSRKRGGGDVLEVNVPVSAVSIVVLLVSLVFFAKTFFTPSAFDGPPLREQLASVVWFFVVMWGLGASLMHGLPVKASLPESFFLRVGLGLGVFPIVSVVLNYVGIPLTWLVFLIVSLIIPVTAAVRSNFSGLSLRLRRRRKSLAKAVAALASPCNSSQAVHTLLAVLFGSILFYVYVTGAFGYPWLEDGDSWQYATSVKYISVFNTYSIPADMFVAHYLEPYPPTYNVLLGMVHQLNDRVSWTLKYFNSLLIALGIVFAYVFVRKFTNDSRIAVLSAFFLAAAPNFMSHFIWSQTLAAVLFFPAFYCLESLRDDKRWSLIAMLVIASVLVVQTSTAFTFGVFFLVYFLVKSFLERRVAKRVFFAGLNGFLLSMAFYWIPAFIKFGVKGVTNKIFFGQPAAIEVGSSPFLTNLGSTAFDLGRTYGLSSLVHAAIPTHIPQPEGIGEVLVWLLLVSLASIILKGAVLKKQWLVISLSWLAVAFVGLESAVLPINVTPSRFWTFLAIPIAIVCATGLMQLLESMRKYSRLRVPLFITVLMGVLITSGVPKYVVQTSTWPYGTWISEDQFKAYLTLKHLPPNTAVHTACYSEDYVIGLDQLTYPWDRELLSFKEKLPYVSADEFHSWLTRKGFTYVVVDFSCLKRCSERENPGYCSIKWKDLANEIRASTLFSVYFETADSVVYEVR